ncbi:2-keto-3-deoxygluconate permease (TC 2.A.10.1.1) [Dethiosulfatibacter aminovorans DSM 17477]|uniref:2-keto-3-deoxygluconate permease (TC 2.A.10.1.1) n=1 Tax=Dethiosulfatibacter aminovorans DSM 17477 TaxID=1121476 RepID=A0A1M6EIA7_9FIRM|nr:2-keto-3-deoxygluconate permease [Dethiosulfatibacter aminovorans]SHI85224.1 2-keto-3-deoxygluconate permease (TC 2.A.10.1.1) [Dethiosulfatibacter aminovorans DSM 17477]
MNILKRINKIPGGLMVVPLFLAAGINTFFPNALKIGSMTSALFSPAGIGTLIGAALFFTGTQLKIKEAPEIIKRGGVLLIAKFLAGFLLGLLVEKVFGEAGLFGISTLAIFSAVTNSNAGMYVALAAEYGDEKDIGAVSLLALNDGPFLTMIAIGASGAAHIPLMSIFATILPMLIGVILGNLDHDISDFFKPGIMIMVPMFSFALGSSINYTQIIVAGPTGLLLGALTLVVSGGIAILADRFINKRPGYAGAAVSTAAANSVATPATIAVVVPAFADIVPVATAQIAAAVIFTAIVSPFFTAFIARKYGCPKMAKNETTV